MSKWFFQFCPKTKFYPRSKKIESISSFPLAFVLWLLFQMTVTVAPTVGLRHVQTCWKAKKDISTFGIRRFLSFLSKLCSMVQIT
jgi:hypothetical protein